jgi:hypothetical protein
MNSLAYRKGLLFAFVVLGVASTLSDAAAAVVKENENLSRRDLEDLTYWRGLVEDLSSVQTGAPTTAPISKCSVVLCVVLVLK